MGEIVSGELHRNATDFTGRRIGRFVVIEYAGKHLNGSGTKYILKWKCLCDCGNTFFTSADCLGKNFKSCGCYRNELSTKHGMTGSREYKCWRNMLSRCYNAKVHGYCNYGERGVKVCGRWRKSFASFFADMGKMPSEKHSIERTDINKGYSPDNCKWATRFEQSRNTRQNRYLTFLGKRQCIRDWSREVGISESTILCRIRRGWTAEESLTIRPLPSGVYKDGKQ